MPSSYNTQKDRHASVTRGIVEPGGEVTLVAPSDAEDLPVYCKALRVYVPASMAEATVRVTAIWVADDSLTATL